MRSDHLSKHVKRHPGYQPGMVKKFRRDKPQGLVSILIPSNASENEDMESMNGEQRKHLKHVAPSQVCVAKADSIPATIPTLSEEKADDQLSTTAGANDRVATVYDGLME